MLKTIQSALQVYSSCGLIDNIILEKESAEYSACTFNLNILKMVFRFAKITPTKNGQFVTLWKRLGKGPIRPFDNLDDVDAAIIGVKNKIRLGHFIFPASVLCSRHIFTVNGIQGKRAFRVYPPWDIPKSIQAAKTQKWQLEYFFEIVDGTFVDNNRVQFLQALQDV